MEGWVREVEGCRVVGEGAESIQAFSFKRRRLGCSGKKERKKKKDNKVPGGALLLDTARR